MLPRAWPVLSAMLAIPPLHIRLRRGRKERARVLLMEYFSPFSGVQILLFLSP